MLVGQVNQQLNNANDIALAMGIEDFADANNLNIENDAEYEKISKMYIDQETRKGYQLANKRLLLWLYSEHAHCVADYAKAALTTVWNQRTARGATSPSDNNAMNKKALQLIQEANSLRIPIKLEQVTVELFIHFLFAMARKNCKGDQKYLSKSGSGNYRSAFKDLYRQCGDKKVPSEFEDALSTKLKGYLRGHQQEKEKNGGRLTEGKDPMPFALYKFLCSKMMEDGSSQAIFAHAFLTITWNLICRSKNTVHIHRKHISWSSDALTIQFAHTKTDKEGQDAQRKRHIYANIHNVIICAHTALGKYLAAFPEQEDGKLFDKGSYARFGEYLRELCLKHKKEVEQLGINIEDIGVHSIRKGAATYCCSGTTSAPHIAAVCNRAGWTMGKVKDTYIQYAEAGDQHVGRVVAGLPVLDKRYACTPPYFRINDEEEDSTATCTTDDVNNIANAFFPCLIETEFRPVAIGLAAALCYAKETIDKMQPNRYVR